VRKLATRREPVNIAMERYYDQSKMEKKFGYKTGAYNETSPNISVYFFTPIITSG
jgi:hypothetical protein